MCLFVTLGRIVRAGLIPAALAGVLAGCATSAQMASSGTAGSTVTTSFGHEREIRQLGKMMEGHYNSGEQAANDKEYFDIRLHIVRIWTDRPESEGLYYYVEQATASAQQRPYRQRVYHLRSRQEDGKIESVVYEVANPLRFAGQWKMDKPLAMLTPDSLITRQGCSVVMRKSGKKEYRGATIGQECLSNLRGAKYAQTDVTITPKQLISWDRGFDEKGEQVWGAKFGGYIFKKETAYTKSTDAPKTEAPKSTVEVKPKQ
jgi:CpeT protein